MSDKLEEILNEVKESRSDGRQLKSWLYGENGFEGDIPQIKKLLKNHNKRIRILEIVIAGLLVSGGGVFGILNLIGG